MCKPDSGGCYLEELLNLGAGCVSALKQGLTQVGGPEAKCVGGNNLLKWT